MLKAIPVILAIFFGFYFPAKSQTFANYSSNFATYGQRVCLVQTTVNIAAPSITIDFLDAPGNTSYATSVYRRPLNGSGWTLQVSNLPAGTLSWTDVNVSAGQVWEYQIRRSSPWIFGGINFDAIGYTCGAVLYDQTNYKGQMILLVTQSLVNNLSTKITRLKKDLTGDGWYVNQLTVPDAVGWDSGSDVVTIKNQIVTIYNNAPGGDKPKALFILGHVPFPRSGSTNVNAPDQHNENRGARGADSYNADIDGIWTDAATFNPGGLQTPLAINLPNDFKFDQDFLPSNVEMAFGRVDFRDITDFAVSETTLTEQYLDRLHNYRQVNAGFFMGSKTTFDFGYANSNDQSLRNLPNISTNSQVYENSTASGYNAAYLSANGPFAVNMQNIGFPDINDWISNGMPATIFSSDQSYWGWGDVPQDNTVYSKIRALLGADTKCLITLWTTTAANQFNKIAIGETFGQSLQQAINYNTTNNSLERPRQSFDTQNWLYRTHLTMYGDPTLRIYQVYPPSNLVIANINNSAQLSWTASTDANLVGYHIYKSTTEFGIFQRLTNAPITTLTYTDPDYQNGNWYMVRALRYQTTGSGTFINPSQGIFSEGNFILPVNLISFTAKNTGNSNLLEWITTNEINNDHFDIERSADSFRFEKIGKVNANNTTAPQKRYDYKDQQPLTNINYYRLKQVDIDGKFQYSKVVSVTNHKTNFVVYPNPANDVIKILGANSNFEVIIYNILGKEVLRSSQTNIIITGLPNGIYTLRNGSNISKFIKTTKK